MTPVDIKADFATWRKAARDLLLRQIAPGEVVWQEANDPQRSLDLLDSSAASQSPPAHVARGLQGRVGAAGRVPQRFVTMARRVACHRDPGRWDLLYRLLWRLRFESSDLLAVETDPDVRRFSLYEAAIRRDVHKTHAFVRFRPSPAPPAGVDETSDGEWHVAWYEPDFRTLGLAAPFFVRRFRIMRWSILTPDCSAHWTGRRLRFGPGATKASAPSEDALDDLWRTYYQSIFNPARVNVRALRAEMPVRRWKNLPEGQVIVRAIADAPRRVQHLQETTVPLQSAEPFVPRQGDLSTLRSASAGCEGCALYAQATQTVFGEGPADADVMMVGEQPGDSEDKEGRPFIGPAGQLLDRALVEAGIDRSRVYVTNAVKHFKWEGRGKWRIHKRPSTTEIVACHPWLEAEIERLKPKLIVCLGAVAAQSLFGPQFRILKERGRRIDTRYAPVALATRHPSSVLRVTGDAERAAAYDELVQDLRAAMRELSAHAS